MENNIRVTRDRRIFIGDTEIHHCTHLAVVIEAGRDPEVEFRISADSVDIDGYTNFGKEEQIRTDSFGFAGSKYNQVIVFRNEEAFLEVLAANPHMEAIIGACPDSKRDFPGVYIAGVKAN